MEVDFMFKKQVLDLVRSATIGSGGVKSLADIGCGTAGYNGSADACYEAMKELYKEGYITKPSLVHNRKTASVDGHKYIRYGVEYTQLKVAVKVTNIGYNYAYGTAPEERMQLAEIAKSLADTDRSLGNKNRSLGNKIHLFDRLVGKLGKGVKELERNNKELAFIQSEFGKTLAQMQVDGREIKNIALELSKLNKKKQKQIEYVLKQNDQILYQLAYLAKESKDARSFKSQLKNTAASMAVNIASSIVYDASKDAVKSFAVSTVTSIIIYLGQLVYTCTR